MRSSINRPVLIIPIVVVVLAVFFGFSRAVVFGAGTPASDSFTRSVSSGWGTATTGGAWTVSGTGISTAAEFNVNGSEGTMSLTAANQNKNAFLAGVSSLDGDATVKVKVDKVSAGATQVAYLALRHISTGNEYRGRLIFNTNGTVTIQATSLVSGSETVIGTSSNAASLTYTANNYLKLRFTVSGTNPTTLTMKAWADGNSEPGSAQYTATDSSAALQTSGSAGILTRLSTSSTNAPLLYTFDDYSFTDNDPSPTPSPTPTATPTPTPTPTPAIYSSASDTYARTVSNGWGTADTGGDYTLEGTASDYAVTNGQATINGVTASLSRYALLNSVSIQNADVQFKFKIDKLPTTASSADAGVSVILRRIGSDEYRARVKITTSGTIALVGTKLISAVESNIGTQVNAADTPTADTYYWVRAQVTGINPTTMNLKLWQDGNSEPGSWTFTSTDSESTLQAPGAVGVRSSLPAAVSNAPILFTYSTLTASTITPTPTPTAAPTYSLSGKVYVDLDGNGVQDVAESGYQGATVSITGTTSASTTTDATGDYTFASLPAGTYTETVTLPSGYLATTTNPVTVPLSTNTVSNVGIQQSTTTTVALDTFTRIIANGWGTADTGGSYTQVGSASAFLVDGAQGTVVLAATGSANQRTLRLDTVSAQNVDYTVKIKYDKLPDVSTGNYVFLIGRHVSSGNEYRGWVRVDPSGNVFLKASKILTNAETGLGTETQVAGLTYTVGTWLDVHIQLQGGAPTSINSRAWLDGDTEPTSWHFSTTDSATILQQAGSIGLLGRLGSVTNTPVSVSFDDLQVRNSTIVTPTPVPTAVPTPVPVVPYSFSSNITKVFTIVLENEDSSNVIGNTTSAPYLNSLVSGVNTDGSLNSVHANVVYAQNYRSVLPSETLSGYLHPSEPNYIWMEAGTNIFSDYTFTVDDTPTSSSTTSSAHLATQLNSAGKVWRAYQENKPSGCPIGNASRFIPRHSPFVFFQDVSSLLAPSGVGTPNASSSYCIAHEFDFSQLATDLSGAGNGVADYNFITPNTCNDGHDAGCPGGEDKVKNADTWLSTNLPTILNSATYQAGHAAIFVMWDEDSGSSTNRPIGMIAISPQTKGHGYTNSRAYSHSSYVKTIQNIFGLTPLLGHAADVGTEDFSDLFGDPVIAAAGDIACGAGSASASCQESATSDTIAAINPSAVLPLGDNQYEEGSLTDFQAHYDPTWGLYKSITAPSVGNHEYLTTSAAGYFDYFNGVGIQSGNAGNRSLGYYSYNMGNWHLIALNTNCSQAGGCGPGSSQDTWLQADLAANTGKCLLAYAHHPRYSSGQQPHNTGVDNLYGDLYAAHADVFLVGHDHNYERFYPSDNNGFADNTNGILNLVVGTGGRNHTQLSSGGLLSNSAVFDATTFGVLKMTLHHSSYDYEFVPSASTQTFTNGTFTDSGSGTCHFLTAAATPTPTPSPSPTPSVPVSITGTVYLDANHDGVQDVNESGQAGVTVKLTGTGSSSATTDSFGIYTFTNLTPGSYSVTARLAAGYTATTADPVSATFSNDSTVNFGIKTLDTTFQPSAPYYATFFYNWFKNPSTDGANQWGIWADPDTLGTHSPPNSWYSNYLPQPTVNTFTPSTSLYSSNDYSIFKWQLSKIAHAKQEIAIASWWGQGDRSDVAVSHQVTDFMSRSDNPYPNLRWAMYYECEGNTCNGTSDPSVTQLTSDLNYIASNYANQPSYLRINNKPVIFAYATPTDGGTSNTNCNDSSMTARWKQANDAAVTPFYVVLKVFGGYSTDVCQPDSWHQYAPAVRTDVQGSYAYMISPGFWRSGDTVRLPRDLSAFSTAAQSMVSSNATWKLVETWNEWGEGSSIEPGVEVSQANSTASATVNPNGTLFEENYIDVLHTYLPDLPQGTGVNTSPTPTPSPTFTLTGTLYIDSNQNGVQDNSETGYGNQLITLSGSSSDSTTTDSNGNYSFSALNQGTYTVAYSIPNGFTTTTANSVDVSITTNTTVNFGVVASASPTPSGNLTLSDILLSPTSTGAIVTWTTNLLADSELYYGLTSFYTANSVNDLDGVFTHTVTVSGLANCTTYHIQVKSLNDVGDSQTSDDLVFTTQGCSGNSTVLSEAAGQVAFSSGGIIDGFDANGHGMRLNVPVGYSSTSAVFQIHQLISPIALQGLFLPTGYNTIGNHTYDVKAFSTITDTITDFDQPLTMTIAYSESELTRINRASIAVMQYHNGTWSNASCSNSLDAFVITCSVQQFSLFTLVSTESLTADSSSGSSATPTSTTCVDMPPLGAPVIFQIDASATTATLYMAPPTRPYTSFVVSYGVNWHDDYYAYNFPMSSSSGAVPIQIGALRPFTYYTFKVRAKNNCAPGSWSGTFVMRTGFVPYRKTKYYLWQQKSLATTVRRRK